MAQTPVGAKIACCDGWAGTLKRLVVDPETRETSHLVIETTPLLSYNAVVPIEHVMATGYEVVFLDLFSAQLEVYREHG